MSWCNDIIQDLYWHWVLDDQLWLWFVIVFCLHDLFNNFTICNVFIYNVSFLSHVFIHNKDNLLYLIFVNAIISSDSSFIEKNTVVCTS